jgi:hypothetical protein
MAAITSSRSGGLRVCGRRVGMLGRRGSAGSLRSILQDLVELEENFDEDEHRQHDAEDHHQARCDHRQTFRHLSPSSFPRASDSSRRGSSAGVESALESPPCDHCRRQLQPTRGSFLALFRGARTERREQMIRSRSKPPRSARWHLPLGKKLTAIQMLTIASAD